MFTHLFPKWFFSKNYWLPCGLLVMDRRPATFKTLPSSKPIPFCMFHTLHMKCFHLYVIRKKFLRSFFLWKNTLWLRPSSPSYYRSMASFWTHWMCRSIHYTRNLTCSSKFAQCSLASFFNVVFIEDCWLDCSLLMLIRVLELERFLNV